MTESKELKLLHALQFAASAHRTQKRKGADQTPYINHLIDVVTILLENGVTDETLLVAAALHDTIEDQPITYELLAQRFGKPVADVVREVTDDKTLEKAVRKQKQVEHAPHKSDLAKQLKIADKISNIRDVAGMPGIGWDEQRRAEYIDWAEQVVNGLRGVNAQLDALFDATLAECRSILAGRE
jgi:(p)ppGpp synthase/HD superfamily hydrolase